ncbi:hypothetical protein [Lewinella sp. W8]|uniref:hypothetical protein n=1 Tax=Lewinella sp. W8 TaxID=2528208 RepID=UPI00106885EE|nr:hypothetical protein [Lewinella sp. W8]MTB51691.1 hypothetical protein [Lewinella sp. W8]
MNGENKAQIPEVNEMSIYEGGSLNRIVIDDLLENEVAIKQLVNRHNTTLKDLKKSREETANLRASLEYLRTTPFIAILALISNSIGSLLIAISVNFITDEKDQDYEYLILIAGIALVFLGSLSTILYPYANRWFNKKE